MQKINKRCIREAVAKAIKIVYSDIKGFILNRGKERITEHKDYDGRDNCGNNVLFYAFYE